MNTIIAWTGAIFFLTAYALLTLKKIRADRAPYQLLNVLGGLCLAISTFSREDYASFFLNAAWMCIGLWGLYSQSHPGKSS
ncbi:MAG TPA: hypothetical protein VEB86_00830 [Chryseosolibacter sp.]|nr:hypothetical protein [Chryseosolibacter sp.]